MVTDTTMMIDSQLVQLIAPYKIKLETNISRIIATSNEEMVKGRPESKLTNFLGDLLLEEGKRYFKEHGKDIEPDMEVYEPLFLKEK